MPKVEHVLLESGVREVPELRAARINHARVSVRSRIRRRALQLDIIDYYFLSVRCWRSGSMPTGYVLDLRFIAVTTTGIVAAVVAVLSTTETVKVHSGHGRATVLEFSGGLGTLGALRIFMVKLAAHTQFAAGAPRLEGRAPERRDARACPP
jgi:hypothetical protein